MEYLVGSKGIGLSNCRDEDYVIITRAGYYKRKVKNGKEYIYINEKMLKEVMSFNVSDVHYEYLYIFNYQFDKNIMSDTFLIEYDILEYKNKVIKLLKKVMDNKLYNFDKRITINESKCSKAVYHIAYNTFIIENNSSIITKKQKEIIQTIHDGNMPIEYLEILKNKIKEITKNE